MVASPNKSKDLLVRDALVGPYLETDMGGFKTTDWLGVFCFFAIAKKVMGFIKRFGLLIFGIILTIAYYENIGVSSDISSWWVVFLFVGLLMAIRRPKSGVTKFGSVNGIGTTLYGKREVQPDGSYIATAWFIVFLLPIFPKGSYRILPNAPKMHFLSQVTTYQRFEPVPLNRKQVINTYLLIYGFIFLFFVLPIIIFL